MTAATPGQAAYEALQAIVHAIDEVDTATDAEVAQVAGSVRVIARAAIAAQQPQPAPGDVVQRLANALANRQVLVIIGEIAEPHTLARPYDLAVQLLSTIDMRLTDDPKAQPAPELAAAMAETRLVRDQLARVLGWFASSGSGQTARVSATVLAREYAKAGIPLPAGLKHLEGQ
jgi:hypothetical protein